MKWIIQKLGITPDRAKIGVVIFGLFTFIWVYINWSFALDAPNFPPISLLTAIVVGIAATIVTLGMVWVGFSPSGQRFANESFEDTSTEPQFLRGLKIFLATGAASVAALQIIFLLVWVTLGEEKGLKVLEHMTISMTVLFFIFLPIARKKIK
jgi:hypothetical protein